MDSRSAPKRVSDTHLANETTNVGRCPRSATARSGFPAPKGSEAGTVPAQQRLRPYDLLSVQHPGTQPIKPDKQQTVDAPERHALRGFSPHPLHLIAKDKA